MWYDPVGHARKDCGDFADAIRANVLCLWNGWVHASETRRALELNIRRGGMKRLMEDAAAHHVETIHYSELAGIRVGSDESRKMKDCGFSPFMLEGLPGVRLRKEEADRAEKQVQEVTGWSDPVEEKIDVVEVACQNYEVLV